MKAKQPTWGKVELWRSGICRKQDVDWQIKIWTIRHPSWVEWKWAVSIYFDQTDWGQQAKGRATSYAKAYRNAMRAVDKDARRLKV